jgi:hypothetical protein
MAKKNDVVETEVEVSEPVVEYVEVGADPAPVESVEPAQDLDEAGEPMTYEESVEASEAHEAALDAEPEQESESVDETVSAPDLASYPVEGERNVTKHLETAEDGSVRVVERFSASSY